jgi:hypothetical protein
VFRRRFVCLNAASPFWFYGELIASSLAICFFLQGKFASAFVLTMGYESILSLASAEKRIVGEPGKRLESLPK